MYACEKTFDWIAYTHQLQHRCRSLKETNAHGLLMLFISTFVRTTVSLKKGTFYMSSGFSVDNKE